jgi:hypothetical protein
LGKKEFHREEGIRLLVLGEGAEQEVEREVSGESQGRGELLEEGTGDTAVLFQEGTTEGNLRIHSRSEVKAAGCRGSERRPE